MRVKLKKRNSIKDEFIRTLTWKRWRYHILDYYGNKDMLTLKPLRKYWDCHHLDMREENYTNLKEERFRPLNSKSHGCVHFLYPYFKKDPFIIDRLKAILEEMVKYNED